MTVCSTAPPLVKPAEQGVPGAVAQYRGLRRFSRPV